MSEQPVSSSCVFDLVVLGDRELVLCLATVGVLKRSANLL